MVKGAIAEVIGAAPFEFDKAAHHVNNIDPSKDLLYGVLTDQEGKYKVREGMCRRNTETRPDFPAASSEGCLWLKCTPFCLKKILLF